MDRTIWNSPLTSRYTSREMQELWSDDRKFRTWRKLWVELAAAQYDLGLTITSEQLTEMRTNMENIDYELVAKIEAETRHDVKSHLQAFAEACPKAASIMHLGATSCFVTDNTDLILIHEGLAMLAEKLARVIHRIKEFALSHKDLACLGLTHLMPAQPVTVGKRACMWLVDLLIDLRELQRVKSELKFLGSQGTTGTHASNLALFNGDINKVHAMNRLIANKFGFIQIFRMTGQTYPRKVDGIVLKALSGLAESIHKIDFDLRILQSRKEIEEPFGDRQVGSTAMPYKRNPMTEERGCSLSRHLVALSLEASLAHMLQLCERTLDDSAGRRIYIPEAFLTVDALLILMQFLFEGLVVYPKVIEKNLREELPFMATEEIIVAMVKQGADRQQCHEKLRVLSQEVGDNVKLRGGENDLIERIKASSYFSPIHVQISQVLNPQQFVMGVAEEVEVFLRDEVESVIKPYANKISGQVRLLV